MTELPNFEAVTIAGQPAGRAALVAQAPLLLVLVRSLA